MYGSGIWSTSGRRNNPPLPLPDETDQGSVLTPGISHCCCTPCLGHDGSTGWRHKGRRRATEDGRGIEKYTSRPTTCCRTPLSCSGSGRCRRLCRDRMWGSRGSWTAGHQRTGQGGFIGVAAHSSYRMYVGWEGRVRERCGREL